MYSVISLVVNGRDHSAKSSTIQLVIKPALPLRTRANSATYADTRLIVCVCKGHHGWKKWNEQRYNEIVRQLLPADRVALWDKAHAARYTPTRMTSSDWAKEIAALKQELRSIEEVQAVGL